MTRPTVDSFHVKMCTQPSLNPKDGFNGSFLVSTKQIVLQASDVDDATVFQVIAKQSFELDCDSIFINFCGQFLDHFQEP